MLRIQHPVLEIVVIRRWSLYGALSWLSIEFHTIV